MRKKIFVAVRVALILLFSSVGMTACIHGGFFIDSDEDDVLHKLETFLDRLQDGNKEGIKALFAPNAIAGLSDFDESLDALFEYYDGEIESYTKNGLITDRDKDSGIERKWYVKSSDVTTTTEVFRMAFYWCAQDTGDKGNVGITSFYILKFNDDPHPTYSYGGDGLRTPGINIGKVYLFELSDDE